VIDVDHSIELLRKLPYKQGEFSARNWGHPFHSLISYPSKLKPSIAHFLVGCFTSAGETVLDPFSGVGTIPFEACNLGRLGVGSDITPLGYHATRAKVDPPSLKEARAVLVEIESAIASAGENQSLASVESEILPYFHERTLKEILVARGVLLSHKDRGGSFVFACLLHILHGNRPYALSRRSHNIMPWPPKGEFVYKPVMLSLREKVERMLASPLSLQFHRGRSIQADVFSLPLGDASCDAILTSPPFHANRDFLRMNRIRLWCSGWDYAEQARMKVNFVENQSIDSYSKIFGEFSRILRPGGTCVLHLGVVGNFDMAKEVLPSALDAGFVPLASINEDTSDMESHGIVDRGATHTHQFLVLASPKRQA
jgi:SAM-dependent methyltransferase